MKILIYNRQKKVELTNQIRSIIKKTITQTLTEEEFIKKCEISVTIVDNIQIQELNKQHRNIDRPTDVLSFPLIDFTIENDDKFGYDGEYLMLGDIVLSLEKAVEQANDYGHSLDREAGFLCVHSTLHLLGYDHDNDENTNIMRQKEELILDKINLYR